MDSKINYKAIKHGQIGVAGVRDTAVVLVNLESFTQMSSRYSLPGKQIDLGQLGTFSSGILSHLEETRGCRPATIKRFKANYRPSSLIQKRLNHARFEKVNEDEVPAAPVVDS